MQAHGILPLASGGESNSQAEQNAMGMIVWRRNVVLAIGCLVGGTLAHAEEPKQRPPKLPPTVEAQVQKAVDRGLVFLKSRQTTIGGQPVTTPP